MTDHFTDRSRAVTKQRCARMRYLEYEYLPDGSPEGTVPGIVPVRQSVAMTVGSCFHAGAARLLTAAMTMEGHYTTDAKWPDLWGGLEDEAVAVALAEFNQQADLGLDVEMGEGLARLSAESGTEAKVMDDAFGALNLPADVVEGLHAQVASGGQEFDCYLRLEQAALLEGLVRAWARRGLPRLLQEYEVLEVEREGRWLLQESDTGYTCEDCRACIGIDGIRVTTTHCAYCNSTSIIKSDPQSLWFLSRPDALLRSRADGSLVIQSFKTTGTMDARKLRDAQRDMQGLTEGVEVEQRLARWWTRMNGHDHPPQEIEDYKEMLTAVNDGSAKWAWRQIMEAPAPPRISAIRYEYLLKGDREGGTSKKASRLSKALSARVGFAAKVQQSPLCYLWSKPGMTVADAEVAHSFSWTDESGKERKLAWQHWQQVPVWEHTTVREWVSMLDANTVQPEAQRDVLGEAIPPAILVYRQDDDLLDLVEQLEAQEVGVVRDREWVRAAQDEGERRSRLNQRFPQTRTACSYPGECAYVPVCYGGTDVRRDPMTSGKYRARVANHPQELVQIGMGNGQD